MSEDEKVKSCSAWETKESCERVLRLLVRMSASAENQVEKLSFENNEEEKSICESCTEANPVSERVENADADADEKVDEAENFSNQSNSKWSRCSQGNNDEKNESLIGNGKGGKGYIYTNKCDVDARSLCKSGDNCESESGKSYWSNKIESCLDENEDKSCLDESEESENESFLSCRSNSECSYYRFSTEL